MPYIRQDKRDEFDAELDSFIIRFLETGDNESTAGRLNYTISRILGAILYDDERISYARINEIIGVLEYREKVGIGCRVPRQGGAG